MMRTQKALQNLHTFKLPATAAYYGAFNSLDELKSILKESSIPTDTPKMVLGGGSNVIFLEDYPGLILHNQIKGIEILSTTKEEVTVRVGAGVVWHELVLHAISKQWHGIENLALIPGSVGAAPVQNIGAYGVEVESCIEKVHFYNWETEELLIIHHDEARFAYRDSIFKQELKGKGVITHVDFKFSLKPQFNISYKPLQAHFAQYNPEDITAEEVAQAVIAIRQSKLPNPEVLPNAGSFFKNPIIEHALFETLIEKNENMPHYPAENGVKIPAAYLIQETGWKGKAFNTVGVHKQQALVLVNLGNGTAKDLKSLISAIQKDVWNQFQIALEPEVQLIPRV